MKVRKKLLLAGAALFVCSTVNAQGVAIKSVSISPLGKANLCGDLGGSGQPPTITIGHSQGSGEISISMIDNLNDGRSINHGSTTTSANASGRTVLTHNFLPPCNRRTASGLKSAYSITVSSGSSSKRVLWGRYP
jgi:hypothetical protein